MILAVLLLQSVSALPDIELRSTIRARSMTVENAGEARLEVTTSPQGRNVVEAVAPPASGRTIRNPVIRLDVEARIADPLHATREVLQPPR